MQRLDTVAIVGVGLIGGSIGLALRQRKLAGRVVGIGRRAASLDEARTVGAIDEATTDLAAGVAEAELIVVCTPIEQIVEHVRHVAAACPAGALITDAGSTKASIVAALDDELGAGNERGVRFIGSHPLAGGEKTGPGEARADLYVGRAVVITPTRQCRAEDCERIEAFWAALGARVVSMSADDHDRAVAATSHLPHLVAAVLVGSIPAETLPLTSTGFAGTTRVAAGDPALWRQILLDNAPHVLNTLAGFATLLDSARAAIEAGDAGKLEQILTEAKQRRDALGS